MLRRFKDRDGEGEETYLSWNALLAEPQAALNPWQEFFSSSVIWSDLIFYLYRGQNSVQSLFSRCASTSRFYEGYNLSQCSELLIVSVKSPNLSKRFCSSVTQEILSLPKRMNFWKFFERPLTPSPPPAPFLENILQFFQKFMTKIAVFNAKKIAIFF